MNYTLFPLETYINIKPLTHKGTLHAYKVSQESDTITPRASTVATFKTGF